MTATIRGLLDPPMEHSLSACPLILEVQGKLLVSGVNPEEPDELSTEQFDTLVEQGGAWRLELEPDSCSHELLAQDPTTGSLAAAWIGTKFLEEATTVKAPGFDFVPSQPDLEYEGGVLWIASREQLGSAFRGWLRQAAHRVLVLSRHGVAPLMIRVLPNAIETRASMWWIQKGAAAKRRKAAWYARIDRDAGIDVSDSSIENQLSEFCTRMRSQIANRLEELDSGRPVPFDRLRRVPPFLGRLDQC